MSTSRRGAPLNRLLDTLPRQDSRRLLAACESVELKFGEILYEPDDRICHLYFPTDSFLSLMVPVDAKWAATVFPDTLNGNMRHGGTNGNEKAVHRRVQA